MISWIGMLSPETLELTHRRIADILASVTTAMFAAFY
jgi:hypothetical protein